MIRDNFAKLKSSSKDKISWRSHEPKRIEAFSDGAFAFGISLIIFSLEVPRSSHDLLRSMKGILPFAVCFAMIFRLWYEQYRFFRRYGMNDVITIALNGMLIFLVLVYIYPLKFTFSIAFHCDGYTFDVNDLVPVMRLYIGGISCVCILFMCMYFNAWLKGDQLKLTTLESYETKSHIYKYLFPSVAGILSIILISTMKTEYFLLCLSPLYASALFAFIVNRTRKRGFHKRFGNVPMIEPHHGAE